MEIGQPLDLNPAAVVDFIDSKVNQFKTGDTNLVRFCYKMKN